jgi:hypothetical protein
VHRRTAQWCASVHRRTAQWFASVQRRSAGWCTESVWNQTTNSFCRNCFRLPERNKFMLAFLHSSPVWLDESRPLFWASEMFQETAFCKGCNDVIAW